MLNPQAILDNLADTLEALSTTGYQWSPTDAWVRSRVADPVGAADRHLGFHVSLGHGEMQGRTGLSWPITIRVSVRLAQDDDYFADGAAHLAALVALDALEGWNYQGCRLTGLMYDFEPSGAEWGAVEISGTLYATGWR